jgi:hypothetical protein
MGSDEPKPPTIDERIQALTQSLELLAAMHRDLEKQVAQRFAETLGFINQLARVAEAREHRIHRLEDEE